MKIIIAYVSVGAGHRKAAEAVYSFFKKHNRNLDIRIVDVAEESSRLFKWLYIRGYFFLVNHALFLWAFGFWLTRKKRLTGFVKRINLLIDRLNSAAFLSLLIKENPDFVISTHFLPSGITAYLKNKHKIKSRLITVITDFGVHPFWIYKGTDMYAAASELTRQKLEAQGVPPENIKVTGIPVAEVFFKRYERAEICRKLGIDENKFTVLVITGSFGIGPIERITDLLHKEAQILVVCARNKKLYARLKAKGYPRVNLFGFVNNIEEMMRVCDVIITKPGGLSVSELLVKEIVPVFISAIPGQETENVKTLASYGIGGSVSSPSEVKDAVLDYKNHPDKILKIKDKIKGLRTPYSVQELYNVVCESGIGPRGSRSV